MKKVGIITMHRVLNCGSVLQAFALQKKISEFGCDCEIIDYVYPNKEHKKYLNKDNSINLKKYLGKIIFNILYYKQKKKINIFLHEYLNLSTVKYSSAKEIKKCPPKYDIYCTGSDQVWNSRFNCMDDVFFLSFIGNYENRFSFASSTTLKDCLDKENLKFLRNYNYLGVREKSSAFALEKSLNRKVTTNIDPTLLLTGKEWHSVLKISNKKIIKRPYILFYILTYSFNPYSEIKNLISDLLRETGLFPVFLYGSIRNCQKFKAKNIINAGPKEFINLIGNAELVVTSSFHGTCFSILQHKKFYSLVDSISNNSDERIISLLNELGLEKQLLEKSEKFSIKSYCNIDYSIVDKKLQNLRNKSMSYLNKALIDDSENNISEFYSARIKNSINDAFYAEGVSWEGKIRTLRTYAEIIVRFILNKPEEYLTLGKKEKELKKISDNNELLMDSISKISEYGNNTTHTEKITEATEDDFDNVVDSIYGMYAYLFISYFKKYGFECKNRTLSMFSLLPPIIRYKTLDYLWNRDKCNSVLADKLNLAILKTFGVEIATEWINKNADLLRKLSCVSEEAKQDLIQKLGVQTATEILSSAPKNMYDVCMSKLDALSEPIEKYGVLYSSYEEAVSLYRQQMHELENSKVFSNEELELKNIMDFCFEGRKSISNEKDSSLYCLSQLRVILRDINE